MNRGELLRDEAIKRVSVHANPFWMETAFLLGEQIARRRLLFTSADIDYEMMKRYPDAKTHDKRAMAGVMKRLQKARIIIPTKDFLPDPRANCHAQNKRVWRSLVFLRSAA